MRQRTVSIFRLFVWASTIASDRSDLRPANEPGGPSPAGLFIWREFGERLRQAQRGFLRKRERQPRKRRAIERDLDSPAATARRNADQDSRARKPWRSPRCPAPSRRAARRPKPRARVGLCPPGGRAISPNICRRRESAFHRFVGGTRPSSRRPTLAG